MKKKILRVQPWYTIIVCFILMVLGVLVIVFPQIKGWYIAQTGKNYIYMIAFLVISIAIIGYGGFQFLYSLQYAIVDETGIEIRGLFYTIANLSWKEIYSIKIERLLTHDGRTALYYNWLTIRLKKKEEVKGLAGRNRRNQSPWTIIATKKNVSVIKQYIEVKEDISVLY